METANATFERGLSLLERLDDYLMLMYYAKEADALRHSRLLKLGWMPPAPIIEDPIYGSIALYDAEATLRRREKEVDQAETAESEAGAMTDRAAPRGRLCAILDRTFSCSVEPGSQG
jgi:hypothetical protein